MKKTHFVSGHIWRRVILAFTVMLILIQQSQAGDHPRLIVKESDYAALRARAGKSPWKEMKANAISHINSHSYSRGSTPGPGFSSMSHIVRAGALAYILDPANKASYKGKIVEALSDWDKLFLFARDWTGHNRQYYLNADWQAAFFNSVLALDVLYNDLTASQRVDLEAKLNTVANWYYAKSQSSYHLANYGLWAIYKNDVPRINRAKAGWRSQYSRWFSSDGVFVDGPGYAICSANSRHGKMHFHHVLEFTGVDNTWYSDPKVASFYEWLYGAAFSPFYRMICFGDTGPNRDYAPFDPGVHKFSKKAFANLAWCANGRIPPSSLFFYAIMDTPIPSPQKPLSRIWPAGCAAFWEDNPSDRSLMGVLWNCKKEKSHPHKEVNAIHLAAYGEHVLRNAGYRNWGKGAHGFSWDYIHNTAVSGNTVLIDDHDHALKIGGGITEGFTAPLFDYAAGDSKKALVGGKHRRNFVFVHPQDGRCGYWVLFDQVDTENPDSSVNVALHPNANNSTTVSDKREYRAKVAPHTYSGHSVYLSIFLGTPPTSVSIKDGLLARMPDKKTSFVGKYLYSTYSTNGEGRRNIVTVLFPHDDTHAKASMTRLSGSGYTGAAMDLGNSMIDYALESSGTSVVTYDGVAFRASAALWRTNNGNNVFYFVRGGKSFDDGASSRRGFASNADVGVYVRDKTGRIISPGTEVTFYYPGIVGVALDGTAAIIVDSGVGWVKVTVPSGTHELKLIVSPARELPLKQGT
ncbi:MAG: hypothetical protein K8S55_09445 [Phycisphaerae bacterium]|nr:hypothetical protein [Phycisphaerae bacterium]